MAECKFCHGGIDWRKVDGKNVPYNFDGTPHKCKKESAAAANGSEHADTIVGRLEAYNPGSATFTVRDGIQKTYAITVGIAQEWKNAGFLQPPENHPDIWMEFTRDKASFIKPGWKTVQKPAWASELSDPTSKKVTQVQKSAQSVATPPQETRTSPEGVAPAATSEKDVWSAECEEFKQLLISTKRDGIQDLLKYLEEKTDFFIAPSSTKYHDARDGGLLHHSLGVYHNLVLLSKTFEGDYPEDSLKIIGLLHDICKANFYKTSFRNVKHEEHPLGDQWVKEPYIDIDDQFPLGHGEKSTILLLRHIALTDTEIMAIRWHMMAYDDIRCSYAGNLAITNASGKYPIIVLMHIADLSASFLEMRPAGGAL
jgi:hypothetical protein